MFSKGTFMTRQASNPSSQEGFALVYMAALLAVLLIFTGLAVDTGRAYVVKAQLTKAVDGAALAAARNLNSGSPKAEATRIFQANFPTTYMGISSVTDPATDSSFFNLTTDTASGVNTVTVTASAVLPTTFMQLANFTQVTVTSTGQAQRRMVDLSLVLDVSSSIGSKWTAVHDATVSFIDTFAAAHDRMSLVEFGNGASVVYPMAASRGFDKATLEADVPTTLPGGSTLMVEGIYRAWDQLRSVPAGTQSGLRIIVLFTDGASNGVPANWDGSTYAKSLRTWDFPHNANDPDSQTWDSPHIDGLYDTRSATGGASPSYSATVPWNSTTTIVGAAWMPTATWHTQHVSSGIPTSFPLQSSTLKVNGVAQNSARGLRHFDVASGKFPAEVWNINNAARNVLEIIADAARNDNGDYPIRIYTIGMGYLVQDLLGTMPETPESILMRIANDKRSADHQGAPQLDGKYFYAATAADVAPAFQGIQNEIVRLSK
jgi:Flp pilus assembly protein TadG